MTGRRVKGSQQTLLQAFIKIFLSGHRTGSQRYSCQARSYMNMWLLVGSCGTAQR